MSTVEIRPSDSVGSTGFVRIRSSSVANLPPARRRRLPVSIPSAQAYYWTRRWQRDEAESVAELERGEGVEFGDANAAIRWLLSDD